jgi:hypothetical protein
MRNPRMGLWSGGNGRTTSTWRRMAGGSVLKLGMASGGRLWGRLSHDRSDALGSDTGYLHCLCSTRAAWLYRWGGTGTMCVSGVVAGELIIVWVHRLKGGFKTATTSGLLPCTS